MTLIKSISGIRGTIGGGVGENLTPVDAVNYAAAYGTWIKMHRKKEHYKVVVGRADPGRPRISCGRRWPLNYANR